MLLKLLIGLIVLSGCSSGSNEVLRGVKIPDDAYIDDTFTSLNQVIVGDGNLTIDLPKGATVFSLVVMHPRGTMVEFRERQ